MCGRHAIDYNPRPKGNDWRQAVIIIYTLPGSDTQHWFRHPYPNANFASDALRAIHPNARIVAILGLPKTRGMIDNPLFANV
jgi:hypothetical protein